MRLVLAIALCGCDAVLGLHPAAMADGPGLAGGCPDTYMHLPSNEPGGDYRFGAVSASFKAAESVCEGDALADGRPTHLIVIDTLAELNIVYGYALAHVPNGFGYWMGLSDAPTSTSSPTWQWITHDPDGLALLDRKPPWLPSQPADTADDDYAYIDAGTGAFGTTSIGGTAFFICECDAFSADASRF